MFVDEFVRYIKPEICLISYRPSDSYSSWENDNEHYI